MSVCTVCLADGATVFACGCNAAVHAECLASLIEHKFRRCKVCLASYNDPALFVAARSALVHPFVLPRLLDFVTSASNAGRHEEALQMLRFIPVDVLSDTSKGQYLFEKGRALALVGKQPQAEQSFADALTLLQGAPRLPSPQHLALVLVGLATSLIDQQKTYAAAHHLSNAIQLTRKLDASVAEIVMRAVGRYFLAVGQRPQHVQTLRTILEIAQADELDPVRRAVVLIELRLAEQAIGEGGHDVCLASALRMVRSSRRYAQTVREASNALDIRPTERLRRKTHPEDILLRWARLPPTTI